MNEIKTLDIVPIKETASLRAFFVYNTGPECVPELKIFSAHAQRKPRFSMQFNI